MQDKLKLFSLFTNLLLFLDIKFDSFVKAMCTNQQIKLYMACCQKTLFGTVAKHNYPMLKALLHVLAGFQTGTNSLLSQSIPHKIP